MNRKINKVAVLGSGVMGSRIACHFANIGVQVLLLDMPAKDATTIVAKNKLVNDALQTAIKSNPAPLYHLANAKYITTGNFEDDLVKIKDADWIIEVIVENLAIKKSLFEKVDGIRKPGTLISSNTSSIPIHLMCEGRSDDFQKHFCGTHFFNPPRYLRLLEIIPTANTSKEVTDFLLHYGDLFLGKTTVLCKDTPAFIANRIGVYSIMSVFHLMQKHKLNVSQIDALTGTVIGHPKSATMRTADVVGIDTLVKVADFVRDACPADEARDLFVVPTYVRQMLEKNMHGDKTKVGFYKAVKNEKGKKEFHAIDPETLSHSMQAKTKFATIDAAKQQEDLRQRFKILLAGTDVAGNFYREFFFGLFQYISNRIPEISEETFRIDDALIAGFGWELGPFATWDALGVEATISQMETAGMKPAHWVHEMLKAGCKSFFITENNRKKYYDIRTKSYQPIPGTDAFLILENHSQNIVWKNSGCYLYDVGDGILNLEWHTKMNSIGGEVLEAVHKSIDLAEKNYCGVVIGNDGTNFSAGANLAMMLMLAIEQEYDELDMACRTFQNASMRIRYSSVPVVVAPHGLTLGGGCEFCLHADAVQAAAETYIGLVEFGVGIIPAGGGSKEMALRAADKFTEGEIEFPELQKRFMNIATAKVATSATEAFDMGVFENGKDAVTINQNRLLADAKQKAIALSNNYTMPAKRNDILVLGRSALGTIYSGVTAMKFGNYASEHDQLIANKLAFVMCGGDLTSPQKVSEQYLLDLEREAFLSLVTTKKSMERIQSILTTGKPLRN